MMYHHLLGSALWVACLAGGLSAQTRLHTAEGTAQNGLLGRFVAGIDDIDGDGMADFLASDGGLVQALSGADRSIIYAIDPASDPHVIGDVDGDGKRDLVVSSNGTKVLSGADGSFIRSHGGPPVSCNVGDYDLDGTDDYAITVAVAESLVITVQSGLDGSQLTLGNAWSPPQTPHQILPVGDLTNDGQTEIAVAIKGDPVVILDLNPHALLAQLDWPGSKAEFAKRIAVGDADADGQLDVAVVVPEYFSRGGVLVFSTTTEQVIRAYRPTFARINDAVADIGDLNRDGATDFAVHSDDGTFFVSGLTGLVLTTWTLGGEFHDNDVTNVGDVDGDGFDDLVISQPEVEIAGLTRAGRWHLISSAVLATRSVVATNCYGGPFQPELGMTLPRLGQSLIIAGQNAPANAMGHVLVGLPGAGATNLGVEGCDWWLDFSNQFVLMITPAAPDWSETVHLPLIPQLAGVSIALQAVYLPTDGPMGFDLTNALSARFGY